MSEIRTDTINNASGDNDSGIDLSTNDQVSIKTANTTAVTVDASQNVGIGTSSPDKLVHLKTAVNNTAVLRIESTATDSYPFLSLKNDAREYQLTAHGPLGDVFSIYDGTAGSHRFVIDSSGNVSVGKSSFPLYGSAGCSLSALGTLGGTADGDSSLILNRNSDDGTIAQFRQANTVEGTISVSGTTVSYNGGHLSRWSQLADNSRDSTILKGTVMTNLDQMAEWTTDGVTEDNEQLNCMAVSSVEGDANVAGVFVNWDNDDDVYTNDMNVAMTGDMVIRIAQGTTVARGDLLMSAGDGTAKTQGDDIVRSKTIAKVTSTNVSHTYDDGTYLVPCVLMAC
jgi:hypothetical protein